MLSPYVRVHRITRSVGTDVLIMRPDGSAGFRAAVADRGQISGWLALVTGRPRGAVDDPAGNQKVRSGPVTDLGDFQAGPSL